MSSVKLAPIGKLWHNITACTAACEGRARKGAIVDGQCVLSRAIRKMLNVPLDRSRTNTNLSRSREIYKIEIYVDKEQIF